MEKKIEKDQQEQMLRHYLGEMIMDLNLRLIMGMDVKACMGEPLLWVDSITLTEIEYPPVPGRTSFRQKLKNQAASLWRRIKFW